MVMPSDSISQTFTTEQRIQTEQQWRESLIRHANKLSAGFEKAMPGNYRYFGMFKKESWEPGFIEDQNQVTRLFPTLTERNTVEYTLIRNLHNAYFRLGIMANSMMTALRTRKRADLEQVQIHMTDFSQLVQP